MTKGGVEVFGSRQNVMTMSEVVEGIKVRYANIIRKWQKKGKISEEDSIPAFFLFGPPGIGKTMQIYQLAAELARMSGRQLVTFKDVAQNLALGEKLLKESEDKYFFLMELDLTKVEPTDFGIPNVLRGGSDEHKTFEVYYPVWVRLLNRYPGILFIDEITNVQRDDVITAAYKIIDQKLIRDVGLHPGVLVVCAGNTEEDSFIVRSLPLPLYNRAETYLVIPPTEMEWCDYMINKYQDDEVPGDVIAFLSSFVREFYVKNRGALAQFEELPVYQRMITTPRSLEYLVKGIRDYELWKIVDVKELKKTLKYLSGYIQPEHFVLFCIFMEKRNNMVKLLESENIDRSTKIAALTYLGEELKEIYKANSFSEVEDRYLIPVNDLGKYLKKLSDERELLGFLTAGARLMTKDTSVEESIRFVYFLIEVMNGKGVEEAKKLAKESKELMFKWDEVIKEMMQEETGRKKDRDYISNIEKWLESSAKTEEARAVCDKLWTYLSNKIFNRLWEIVNVYAKLSTGCGFSKVVEELKRIECLSDEDVEKIKGVFELVERRVKESVRKASYNITKN
ncbi:MAG: ATP-binding protein [Fervidicoccaceae archaeon]